MGARRKGREQALQILYQLDLNQLTEEQALHAFFDSLSEGSDGESFARTLVRGYLADRSRVDDTIAGASDNWRLDRMAVVDRNILRLATYELLLVDEIPTRVSINEAIELAKRFGAEGSSAFVNGILDRIAAAHTEG